MIDKSCILDNENLLEEFNGFDGFEEFEEFEKEVDCTISKSGTNQCCINTEKFVTLPPCKTVVCEEVDTELHCLGRILRVKVKLDNLCPCKKVAVAVLIFEENKLLCFKVGTIMTGSSGCNLKKSKEFCFAIEDNDLCRVRVLTIQIVANYCYD
jgi:hypothetical protein